MPDNAHHDFYRRLMEATASEVDPRRVDADRRALMALIAEIFGLGRSAVLLWLLDSGGFPEVEELRLAYIWYGDGPERERPDELCNRILPKDQNPATARLGWLDDWYGKAFPGAGGVGFWSSSLRDTSRIIGHIHVLSHSPQGEQQTAGSDPRLKTVLAALTTKIVVGRTVRANGAMQELQKRLSKVRNDSEVWDAIARTAREFTAAKLALVYRPVGVAAGQELSVYAGSLRETQKPRNLSKVERDSLASTSDSVTWKAFAQDGVIRIRDIKDEDEVFAHFGMRPSPNLLKHLDHILVPAESWMVVSVLVDSVSGKPGGIILIKLMNKQGGAYLHDSFTLADAAIMESIGEFLATYLPGREVTRAVSAIAKPLQRLSMDGVGAGGENTGEPLLDSLVKGISDHVQGVEGLAFQFSGLPSACSSRGQDLAHYEAALGRRQSMTQEWPDGRLLYVSRLGGNGCMLVLLRDNDLPEYQAEIIRRVGAEVVWLYHEIISYRQAVQRTVEIRHAIRSGVQGVLGNVKPALSKLGMIARDPRPEIIEREFIRGAQFRKALEKALIAASHVGKVLEEGRYAYTGVRHDGLRLGSHKLPALVFEVLSVAKIEADLRGISIKHNNLIQKYLDDVVCDRAALIIVLQNIVENAIKYGFRDTEIMIRMWVSGGVWFVSVEDEGVYIDPADHQVIFQPFKRVATHDPAATGGESRRPGTGLGLSICRRIVEAHDSRARIDVTSLRPSRPDSPARTTFTISMPRRLAKAVVAEEQL